MAWNPSRRASGQRFSAATGRRCGRPSWGRNPSPSGSQSCGCCARSAGRRRCPPMGAGPRPAPSLCCSTGRGGRTRPGRRRRERRATPGAFGGGERRSPPRWRPQRKSPRARAAAGMCVREEDGKRCPQDQARHEQAQQTEPQAAEHPAQHCSAGGLRRTRSAESDCPFNGHLRCDPCSFGNAGYRSSMYQNPFGSALSGRSGPGSRPSRISRIRSELTAGLAWK